MSRAVPSRRFADVERLAASQEGVISRRQLYEADIARWTVRNELAARRWRCHHRQAIIIHCGPLSERGALWAAVIEAGGRGVLDGVSSLIADGLKGYESDHVRISVPRGAKVLPSPGAVVRQTRRLRPSDIRTAGIRRTRPEIAVVRAALWARSDKQAGLIMAMVVQQRLATATAVGGALLEVKRDKRRRFLECIVLDLLDGAQSLGEIDFAKECRHRGLPTPDRQSMRKLKGKNAYLDVRWKRYRLVVEVDGIGHTWVTQTVPDAWRQNEVTLEDATVLRLPVLALRVAADEFFEQIERALRANGWHRPNP